MAPCSHYDPAGQCQVFLGNHLVAHTGAHVVEVFDSLFRNEIPHHSMTQGLFAAGGGAGLIQHYGYTLRVLDPAPRARSTEPVHKQPAFITGEDQIRLY